MGAVYIPHLWENNLEARDLGLGFSVCCILGKQNNAIAYLLFSVWALQKSAFGGLLPRALFLLPTSHGHENGSGLAYLALPDLEHWKKTVMLHLTTLRLCMPWSPKASISIEQVWHPVNYFPRFVSTTLTAFLPGNFFHYLQAAKQIALNIFNKHTTILRQSYLTSSDRKSVV